jgi:hypothetical protein
LVNLTLQTAFVHVEFCEIIRSHQSNS